MTVVLGSEVINEIHHDLLLYGVDREPIVFFFVHSHELFPYEKSYFNSTREALLFLCEYPNVYKFAKRVFNDPVTKMFFDVIGFE